MAGGVEVDAGAEGDSPREQLPRASPPTPEASPTAEVQHMHIPFPAIKVTAIRELFNNGSQDSLVRQYSTNASSFSSNFAVAMVKMGSISTLTGSRGQMRLNRMKVN
ncbi:peroxidase P7-like isoform X1 [Canna indica]|uniref:Peroxidase P7-like isoform X1 n=1 Tax=Canna indica TaxID=4628 RepID=A0AAQ3JRH2_9LILI|nr:peroxidase P7-like isoform X1 [Canna indica]